MGAILKGGHWKVSKEQLKTWLPTGYYYFFYGALGSLFPFLNLYYRAVGMDPWQIGILGGMRPLIALLCAPIWCCLSNRYKIRKLILVASLVSWIGFTLPFTFVRNSAASEPCPGVDNSTTKDLSLAASKEQRKRTDSERKENSERLIKSDIANHARTIARFDSKQKMSPNENKQSFGLGNISLEENQLLLSHELKDFNKEDNIDVFNFVGPSDPPRKDVKRSVHPQRRERDKSKQPRFIGVKKPFVNSYTLSGMKFEVVTDKKAEPGDRKPYDFKSRGAPYYNKRKNPYADTIFAELFFIVLIGEVLQSPTDDFNTHFDGTFLEHLGVLYQNVRKNNLYSSIGIGLIAFATGLTLRFAPKIQICDEEYGDYRIAFVFFAVLMFVALVISTKFNFTYRRRRRSFEIRESAKNLLSLEHATFVFIVVIMGMLRGVLFNFVYWNIVDLGGSDLVVGITVVSQYLSDTIMNLSAPILMTYLGYIGMVYLGLASYALRFLIYSWLSTPESAWVTPPVELLQGVSHATVWSAFLLYITNYTPRSTFPTGVFFLQGLYLGVGGSIGAIIGGILIQSFDTNVAFRLFGLVSVFTCLLFVMIQPSGINESLPSEADTIPFLTDEDDYSSYSEDELFDYSQRGIVYIPSKHTGDGVLQVKKVVLPTYGSPLVPICMSFGSKEKK